MKRILPFLLAWISTVFAYVIEPGDVLTVDVYFQSGKVISRTVKVDYDGKASLPYIGYVEVAGKDIEYVRSLIQKKTDEFLPSSIVVVYLLQPHHELVYFHGTITGSYDISQLPPEMRRLSSVMATITGGGGGVLRRTPDIVRLIRNGKVIDVEFRSFLKTGDRTFDPILEEGDVVYIPAPNYAGVFGEGVVPGVYELEDNMDLLELLSKAQMKMNPSDIKKVKVFRGGKLAEFSGNDLKRMKEFPIKGGDMVVVETYEKFDVYVVGDVSARVEVSEKSNPTLRSVLSTAGISFSGNRWIVKLIGENRNEEFEISEPEEIPEVPVENGDIVVVKRIPEYVFFKGVVSGKFDLSEIPPGRRRLSIVLSMVASQSQILPTNFSKVTIERDGTEITLRKIGNVWEKDPVLEAGDVVRVIGPSRVIVQGEVTEPGVYDIDDDDLLMVLSKAKVDITNVKSIELIRKGKVMTFEASDMNLLKNLKLKDGDILKIDTYKNVNVYISGVESKKVVFSERDEPDLRKLIALSGLNLAERRYKITVQRNGTRTDYIIDDPRKIPQISLQDGDLVIIDPIDPPKIYVGGVKNGGVVDISEEDTLRKLIYKFGISEGFVFVTRGSSTSYFKVEDVVKGEKDLKLENGDFVYVSEFPFGKVNVIYRRSSVVPLERIEESLKDVLIRSGALENFDSIESIEVLKKEGKKVVFEVDDVLLKRVDTKISDGDVIIIKPKSNKVIYVIGDIGRVLTFSADEEINENTILSKLGVSSESVEKIEGDMRDGGVVRIRLKQKTLVYVHGDVVGSKVVIFEPSEERTLRALLGKIGVRFPSRDFSFKLVVFRRGNVVFERDISTDSDPEFLDFELMDGDFVKTMWKSIEVDVFGNGVKQGRYSLPEGSKLSDLIAKMGGIPMNYRKLKIMRAGKIKEVSLESPSEVELVNGDVVLFEESPDDFAYVFGDVLKPGAVFVGGGEKLIKVLSLSGGLSGWDSKRKVKIFRGGEKEEILDLDQRSLMEVEVHGGDVVYLIPRTFNRVYVLGAVIRPSVVPIDRETTLLDAIMRAGGFSKNAVKDRIHVFRGGVKGPVEVYDMNWITSGETGRNPKLQPGDVVYVPDNPLVSLNDMISLITPMMNFLNNSIYLYKNLRTAW